MQRDTLKKFYIVHSWVGVITGILLFIIAFTGALSVFGSPELKLWANEALHQPQPIQAEKVSQLLEREAALQPDELLHEVMVLLPGPDAFGNLLLFFEGEHGPNQTSVLMEYDPRDLTLLNRFEGAPRDVFAMRKQDMESFITRFHADLHLGQLGLMLTGLLGLTLMASIVTGLIIHRKILRELFSFRPLRSIRLMLTDSHKVLSVWGVLFHTMIGFTGAFLGLATIILLPAAAYVSFQGDEDKLLETFQPQRMPTLSGNRVDMRLDLVLNEAQTLDRSLRSVVILGWGDDNALAFVNTLGNQSMSSQIETYRMRDAQHQGSSTSFELVGGNSGKILDLISPLHFGNFGGLPIKIIWAILGISTSLIAITGLLIWVERRAFGAAGNLKQSTYFRLSRLTVGSCIGLVLASVSLFYSQRLLPDNVITVFFLTWGASLVWSLLKKNDYRTSKQLLGLSGLLLMAIPLLDALTLEHHLFNSLGANHTHLAAIDASLSLLGILLIRIALKLPAERTQAQHRRTSNDRDTKLALPSDEISPSESGQIGDTP